MSVRYKSSGIRAHGRDRRFVDKALHGWIRTLEKGGLAHQAKASSTRPRGSPQWTAPSSKRSGSASSLAQRFDLRRHADPSVLAVSVDRNCGRWKRWLRKRSNGHDNKFFVTLETPIDGSAAFRTEVK